MGSLLSRIASTISEYIRALPGLLSHMALEGAGEALIEGEALAALGVLTAAMLMFGAGAIFAETLSGDWNSRPRSLFSYEKETGSAPTRLPSTPSGLNTLEYSE